MTRSNNVSRDPRYIYDNSGNAIGSNANYKNPLSQTDVTNKQTAITNDINNFTKQGPGGSYPTEDPNAFFAATTQEAIDNYNSGAISQEEAVQHIYDALTNEQKSLIPDYQRQTDEGIATLNNQVTDSAAAALKQKANVGNTYGTLIRGSRANTNSATNNLKNMFSSLGTAESSAFINKAGDIERAGLQNESDLGNTSAQKQTQIDELQAGVERDTKAKINSLIADRQSKIDAVNRQVNATDQEKKDKLVEINQNLSDAIQAVKTDVRQKQYDILLARQGNQDALAQIAAQGNVNSGLLDKQFAQQQALVGAGTGVDPDISQLSQPYSGMGKISAANNLKSKYPTLADLIDGVANGTRSVEELKKAIGTAGSI